MGSKGFLSIFMVLGITLLVALVLVIVLGKGQNVNMPLEADHPESELRNYVESCLELVGEKAVYDVSLRSGYFYFPAKSNSFFGIEIAYYWDKGKNLMPSEEKIEEELADYVQRYVRDCLHNLEVFASQGYEVEMKQALQALNADNKDEIFLQQFDDAIFTSAITTEGVVFRMKSLISLQKGGRRFSADEFHTLVPIDLEMVISTIRELMDMQKTKPNSLLVGDMALLAKKEGFTLETIRYGSDSVIISLLIPIKGKEDLIFSFMERFDWSSKS